MGASNEELGIGDGVGFIMDFICGVVERYAGDFILQFLCVMSGIYWHLTRMGAHCAPANLNRQYFFQWSRIGQTATRRCSSSSPPTNDLRVCVNCFPFLCGAMRASRPTIFSLFVSHFKRLNRLIFLSGMFVPRFTTMIHYSFLTQRFFQAKNASRPGPTVRREAF